MQAKYGASGNQHLPMYYAKALTVEFDLLAVYQLMVSSRSKL